ncbi:MAG: hypothetical protein AAFN93_24440 [Bacteroidota bacterium]
MKGAKYWIAYRLYFGISIGDQDKPWAPHVICGSCRSNLDAWLRGARKAMPFAVPRVWREPKNHHDDCYFCMIDISKYRKAKGRKSLPYPSIPSSIAPVPHGDTLPVPQLPTNVRISYFSYLCIPFNQINTAMLIYFNKCHCTVLYYVNNL